MRRDEPGEQKNSSGEGSEKLARGQGTAHQNVSGENATGFNFGAFSGSFVQAPKDAPKAAQPSAPSSQPEKVAPVRLLFLAANPVETVRLRLDEEVRELGEILDRGPSRGKLEIQQHWAVRVADLLPLLLRHRPSILHFSGHGGKLGGIVLEDSDGSSVAVPGDQLAQLFGRFTDRLRCVFLNACFSLGQATQIAEAVDCVVGVSGALEDKLAIQAAGSFYQSLSCGYSVQDAFELTRADPALFRIVESGRFHLVANKSDPSSIYFAQHE